MKTKYIVSGTYSHFSSKLNMRIDHIFHQPFDSFEKRQDYFNDLLSKPSLQMKDYNFYEVKIGKDND